MVKLSVVNSGIEGYILPFVVHHPGAFVFVVLLSCGMNWRIVPEYSILQYDLKLEITGAIGYFNILLFLRNIYYQLILLLKLY
jgi:hypothetical protein